MHTENQLPRLSGSALKVPVGWVPTHYQVKLQLMLRLSWAVTMIFLERPFTVTFFAKVGQMLTKLWDTSFRNVEIGLLKIDAKC